MHASFLTTFDPRMRLAMLLWLAALALTAQTKVTLLVVTAVIAAGILLSPLTLKDVVKSARGVLVFVVAILLVQTFTHSGEIVFRIGDIYGTKEGLVEGMMLSAKLMLLTLVSRVFLSVTSPSDILDALEWPLRVWPRSSSLLLTVGLTINFVPMFVRSARQIKAAQIAKGADDSASSFTQIRFAVSAAFPILVSAMRSSQYLADAIDSRSFTPSAPRTPFATLRLTRADALLTGLLACVTILWFAQ